MSCMCMIFSKIFRLIQRSSTIKNKKISLSQKILLRILDFQYQYLVNDRRIAIVCKFSFKQIQILMSSETLKQLKIKSSILKRLRKEYESYQKQTKSIEAKIQKNQALLHAGQHEEQAEAALRKNRQFLIESQSVLSNVKQKLIEAFQGLAQYLSQNGDSQGIDLSEQKNQAEDLILEVEAFLQNLD